MNINLTLLGQMVTFLLFVAFTMRFVWPPLIKALEERRQKIAEGLAAAEQGERQLISAQEKVAELIDQAKKQSASIIQQAEKRNIQLLAQAKEQARKEGEHLIAGAKAELEQMQNSAREVLRKEVANLTLITVQKLLGTLIDDKVNEQLIHQTIAELKE